jgi:hypothetical protein
MDGPRCPYYDRKFMCPDARGYHPAHEPWDFVHEGVAEGMLATRRMAEALVSKNSTLWLLGDSLARQHLRALQCQAFKEGVSVTSLPAEVMANTSFTCHGIAGARVCCGKGFYSYLPKASDDLEQLQYMVNLLEEGNRQIIRPQDVVMFNLGVHYLPSEVANAERNMRLIADHLRAIGRRQPLPCIVWRSVTPQHFPTRDGLWFAGVTASKLKAWPKAPDTMHPCRKRVDSAPEWRNARRAMLKLDEVAESAGWYILEVWEAGAERGADHVGRWRTAHVGEGYDCTHFCEPSSFLRFFAEALVIAVNQLLLN